MKSFRQILGEVAQPKPEEERAFKDMHSYETMPHPVALDHQFTGEIAGAGDATRIADQKGDAKYDTSYDDAFEYAGPSFDEQANQAIMNRLAESNLDEASASVYKDMPKAPGKMVSNRVQVKAFKDVNAMGAFLSKQNDNSWQKTDVPGLKSGKYKIDMVKKGGKPSKNFIRVNEEVELDEALSPQQISKMKKQYANTGDRISIEASKKMSAMVKKFGDEELVQLAKADIKWISTSAITALIIKGKAKLLDESLDIDTSLDEAGLWDNIHNKRKEGRPMRKPGSKGAPSKQDFKNASEETDIDEILTPDLAKAVKSSGLKKFKDKHFNVKKTKSDLDALKARLAKMK